MASPLAGSLARTIGSAMSGLFLDAVLKRDELVPFSPAPPPWEPQGELQEVEYTCKAIVDRFSAGLLSEGLVNVSDVKIVVLATTLNTTPRAVDRITMLAGPAQGQTFTVVPDGTGGLGAVNQDPAGATWELRASK